MFDKHLCKVFHKAEITVGDILCLIGLWGAFILLALVASYVTGAIMLALSDTILGWAPIDVHKTTATAWDICVVLASGAVTIGVWGVALSKVFSIKIAECPLKKEKEKQ